MGTTNAWFLIILGTIGGLICMWLSLSEDGVNSIAGIRAVGVLTLMFSSLIFAGLCWVSRYESNRKEPDGT